MRKFSLFYLLAAMLLATGCESEVLDQEIKKPVIKDGQTSISITGDGMVSTRSSNGRVEFTGGYATGAGLYAGDAYATVEAVPYDGYQLVNFAGGPIGGNTNQFSGRSQYEFNIESQDWQFKVTFKKKDTKFIAVGDDGSIVYYDNGNVTTQKVGTGRWYAVTYGNGKYVAVGGYSGVGGNAIAYSSNNGETWNSTTGGTIRGLLSVTYGNSVFAAVGNGGAIAYSTDGINWVKPSINIYETFNSIAYGNGKFVAVSSNSATSIVSSNGVSWDISAMPWIARSIIFDGTRFVLLGSGGETAFSSDGTTWEIGNTVQMMNNAAKMAYGNGSYVSVCDNHYTGSKGAIFYSTDAINWTMTFIPNNNAWNDIAYGNGQFVAVGQGGDIAKSTDGVHWEVSIMGDSSLFGICFIQ